MDVALTKGRKTKGETFKPAESRRIIRDVLEKSGTIIGLIAMVIFFSIARPETFFTMTNLINILNQITILAIMSFGLTCPLIIGDFDLSLGSIASLAGVLAVGLLPKGNMYIVVLLVLAVGAFIGLINGLIVTYLRLSAFIATLGTASILVGYLFWFTAGATLFQNIPPEFLIIGRGFVGPIPIPVIIMVVLAFVLWMLLTHTETGREMYAIGGNMEAARLAGIKIERKRILAFVLSGLAATIGGILLASRLGVGQPNAGDGFLLNAFAAAFLGAATIRDEFHISGTFIGALVVGVATNGLTIISAPFWVQNVFTGGILIVAVAASNILRRSS